MRYLKRVCAYVYMYVQEEYERKTSREKQKRTETDRDRQGLAEADRQVLASCRRKKSCLNSKRLLVATICMYLRVPDCIVGLGSSSFSCGAAGKVFLGWVQAVGQKNCKLFLLSALLCHNLNETDCSVEEMAYIQNRKWNSLA